MNKLSGLLFSAMLLATYTVSFGLQNQFYAGILGGYGSTNWSRLATNDPTLQATLPASASDTGFTGGLFIGDDINQYFGIEIRYQKFADSQIDFTLNEYNPPDFAPFSMTSKISAGMFLGKLRIPLNNKFQAYSILGGSYTMRSDRLASVNGFGGVFGAGTDFAINTHWHNSLEFDFVTGNAAINETPAQNYQPFLTSFADKVIFYF